MSVRKKIFSILLALCIFVSMFCIPAPAANAADATKNEEKTIYYEDGSYAVVTITYDLPPIASVKAATRTTSGLKEYAHYNKADQLLWTFQVHGSFEYDGRSAEATSADYSKDVYDSAWSFVRADAYCSGASAVANGAFKESIFPISTTITLTCSVDGVLS